MKEELNNVIRLLNKPLNKEDRIKLERKQLQLEFYLSVSNQLTNSTNK